MSIFKIDSFAQNNILISTPQIFAVRVKSILPEIVIVRFVTKLLSDNLTNMIGMRTRWFF